MKKSKEPIAIRIAPTIVKVTPGDDRVIIRPVTRAMMPAISIVMANLYLSILSIPF